MIRIEAHTEDIDKVQHQLRGLQRRAEALGKRDSVSFDELFAPAFLKKYTNFASLEELFEASGFAVESQEDFEEIPDAEWERFIKSNTRFSSWEEMIRTALKEFVARELGF
ncbi:MAG: hypothetical protein ACOC6F_01560 [bacterium]